MKQAYIPSDAAIAAATKRLLADRSAAAAHRTSASSEAAIDQRIDALLREREQMLNPPRLTPYTDSRHEADAAAAEEHQQQHRQPSSAVDDFAAARADGIVRGRRLNGEVAGEPVADGTAVASTAGGGQQASANDYEAARCDGIERGRRLNGEA
jgi:hypothetical protein